METTENKSFFKKNELSLMNDGNCGVVGCWGTDSQGRKTLNGKVFEISNTQKGLPISVTDPKLAQQISELGDKQERQMVAYNYVKNYGIVLLALVAGYFAYKKFKK